MKLTKEDLMRLPKERLAELILEMDSHPVKDNNFPTFPSSPRQNWWCDGYICTNPQMDCINCPRRIRVDFNTSDSSGATPLTAK